MRFVPLKDVDPRFALALGLSDDALAQKLKALIDFVELQTGYRAIERRSRIINAKMHLFYVLTFSSEVIAEEIRAAYEKFAAVNIFTGEDLTYRER